MQRWDDYSRAKDEMLVHTDIPEAPWNLVESEDKRRARINMISHLLDSVPYREVPVPVLKIPKRPRTDRLSAPPRAATGTLRADHAAMVESQAAAQGKKHT